MAISIPRVSNQLKSLNKNTILTISAIISILIIGSPNDSISNFKKLFCLSAITSFEPFCFLDLITSLSVSPL